MKPTTAGQQDKEILKEREREREGEGGVHTFSEGLFDVLQDLNIFPQAGHLALSIQSIQDFVGNASLQSADSAHLRKIAHCQIHW